jgi:hypothetical protein
MSTMAQTELSADRAYCLLLKASGGGAGYFLQKVTEETEPRGRRRFAPEDGRTEGGRTEGRKGGEERLKS